MSDDLTPPQNPDDPQSSGEKRSFLTRAHKRLIMQRIVAGDSNSAIRARLRGMGLEELPGDSKLAYYRKKDKVREAFAQVDLEFLQAGIALRGRRLEMLNWYAQELFSRMRGRIQGEEDMPGMPVNLLNLTSAGRELRETIKLVSAMVDLDPRAEAALAAEVAQDGATDSPRGFYLGMLSDAIEEWLRKKAEAGPEADAAEDPQPKMIAGDADAEGG